MVKSTPRRVVLGITGGVAAYKTAELVRLLVKSAVEVQVVMSAAGARFITPVTLQALSGRAVFTDAWDPRVGNNMAHIELSRGAEAIVVAPASADFIAKLAHGLADDLLSTLCLARQPTCRLLVAPAMNREMWEKPATQRNVARLRADGVHVLGPAEGEQACGETGLGRMLEPDEIADAILHQQVGAGRLIGLHAMVTAGPTFEPIDPVRGITNRSSGKMGYAIAKCLIDEGAQVTLVSGPTGLTPPDGAKFVGIETSSQMFEAVNSNLEDVELFFSVAAVADYTPTSPKQQKMKKAEASLNLKLKPTQDILATVAARRHPPFCVGFAAESEKIVEYASKKRERKKIPVIVANHAPSAIGSAENEVTIIDASGIHPVARAAKEEIARKIVDHVVKLYQKTSKTKKKTG